MEFRDLPPDVIGEIARHGDPRDVASLARTARIASPARERLRNIREKMLAYKLSVFYIFLSILQQESISRGHSGIYTIGRSTFFIINIDLLYSPFSLEYLLRHLSADNVLSGSFTIIQKRTSDYNKWLQEFTEFINIETGIPLPLIPPDTNCILSDSRPAGMGASVPSDKAQISFSYHIKFSNPSDFIDKISRLYNVNFVVSDLNYSGENTLGEQINANIRVLKSNPQILELSPLVEPYIHINPTIKL